MSHGTKYRMSLTQCYFIIRCLFLYSSFGLKIFDFFCFYWMFLLVILSLIRAVLFILTVMSF